MRLTKFEVNLFFNIYIGLILFGLIVSSLISIPYIIFLFLFFAPFIFFVYKFSSLRILLEILIFLVLIFGTIFFTFRSLRSLFHPPEIDNKLNVGYVQYFGYPFHFDTLLFFFFLIIPLLAFSYILFRKKNRL